jgi:mycothiol synthase
LGAYVRNPEVDRAGTATGVGHEPAITLRSYAESDVPAVAAFFTAAHRIDHTIQQVSETSWRYFASLPFNRDARDFMVVEQDGEIVAILTSTILEEPGRADAIRHFRIVVHPEYRKRGIGTALLGVVERDREGAEARIIQCNCPDSWEPGMRFLERHGFTAVEIDFQMERPDGEIPVAGPPEGITLRPYAGACDHADWARIHNDAYSDLISFAHRDAESIGAFAGEQGFGLWLAGEAGETVGFCHFNHEGESDGVIESLAVLHRARGRGIGRALITAAMHTLRDRGRHTISLNVLSDNAPALALYRSLGFEVTGRTSRYRHCPDATGGNAR